MKTIPLEMHLYNYMYMYIYIYRYSTYDRFMPKTPLSFPHVYEDFEEVRHLGRGAYGEVLPLGVPCGGFE